MKKNPRNADHLEGLVSPYLTGDLTNITGNVTGLKGHVSPLLHGDVTHLVGSIHGLTGDASKILQQHDKQEPKP